MRNPFGLDSPFERSFRRAGGGAGAAPFEETFMAGREGAMFTANDMTLLFQDTAAETPVTAAGQNVNAMYDASGTVLLTNTGTSGGFVYRHDGTNGYLEADGTGAWSSSAGLLSGLSGNFYVAYKKTTLITGHSTRYTHLWRTADNEQGLYFDQGTGATRSDLIQKTVRIGGTDVRPSMNSHDSTYPVNTKLVTIAQFDTTDGSIRVNCLIRAGEANSGTAINSIDDTVELLRLVPGEFYGFGLFTGLMGAPAMVALEDYCLDLVSSDIVKAPIVAHRGFASCNAQGTIPAYTYAGDLGILQWEGDLRVSGDGTWHIFHDATVDALTDGTGTFSALTDAYVASLSVEGSGDPPAVLADLLMLADSYGVEKLYLEIKDTPDDADIDAVVAQIVAAGWESKVNISSFQNSNLTRVRVTNSVIELGYTGETADWASQLAVAKSAAPAAMIWPKSGFTSRASQIADAHDTAGGAARIPVVLWTVTGATEGIDAGADGADAVVAGSHIYARRTDLCLP